MSKVDIFGPKNLLMEVLAAIQQLGFLHLEVDRPRLIDTEMVARLRSFALDDKTLAKRLFYEDLYNKIRALLDNLPRVDIRAIYLSPRAALESVRTLVDRHNVAVQRLAQQKKGLTKEQEELLRYSDFLNAVAPLFENMRHDSSLDFLAIEIKDPLFIDKLASKLGSLTEGAYEMQTAEHSEGRVVGLIAAEKKMIGAIRKALAKEQIPEFFLPEEVETLPFKEKIERVRSRVVETEKNIAAIDTELQTFARHWTAVYLSVRNWLRDQLTLLQATASIFETEMCFFIIGWLPSDSLPTLRDRLNREFKGQVVLEEQEVHEQDMEKAPVSISNPPYFRPFELFTRLLPLPHYSSFDPTIFIGLFFPLFFGMILGDIGYGAILMVISLLLVFTAKKKNVIDVGKILFVCACYTVVFGFLYGEFFGTVGKHLFNLKPLYIDRHESIVPMLYFALAVGTVHVCLGLFLGFLTALRRKKKKEAVFKLASILMIFCLVVLLIDFLVPQLSFPGKPLLGLLLVIVAVSFFCGGLLAPLELFKTVGNIISYARIMAIGLTSVLLAYVANRLAGSTGSLLLGALTAVLLHTFNILLGIFAPTIHSLRLHYVEFFSKFIEPGGRQFKPLEKK